MIEGVNARAACTSPLDAGVLREELFEELIALSDAGAVVAPRTERFYERVSALSQLTGIAVETILADLRAELEGLV